MYALINQHIDQTLETIDEQREIQRYVWLIRNLSQVNVAADPEYQCTYRQYWQLNAARLSEGFCLSYFALLEELKQASNTDVGTVARRLLNIPPHGDGRRAVQFSFASKLVHMLDHRLPIYDSMVESFYFLPQDTGTRNPEARLRRLLASYDFLVREYARVLDRGLLRHAIDRFRQRYGLGQDYSEIKTIDTLIWRFVGFLRDGGVRDGTVVYD